MHDPFVLYGGRIDPGKGCEELLEYFQTYVKRGRRRDADADGRRSSCRCPTIRTCASPACCRTKSGFTRSRPRRSSSCRRRTRACRCSRSRRSPSARRCSPTRDREVLVEHCRRSNAGLFYADRWEFVEALKLLHARCRRCARPWAPAAGVRQPALPLDDDPRASTNGSSADCAARLPTPTPPHRARATTRASAARHGWRRPAAGPWPPLDAATDGAAAIVGAGIATRAVAEAPRSDVQ